MAKLTKVTTQMPSCESMSGLTRVLSHACVLNVFHARDHTSLRPGTASWTRLLACFHENQLHSSICLKTNMRIVTWRGLKREGGIPTLPWAESSFKAGKSSSKRHAGSAHLPWGTTGASFSVSEVHYEPHRRSLKS